MKLIVVHPECGREMLVQQIIDSHGHCPWDGKPFERNYTAVLAEALRAAEDIGGRFEDALDKVADLHPSLRIEPESVLGPLTEQLSRLNGATTRVRR